MKAIGICRTQILALKWDTLQVRIFKIIILFKVCQMNLLVKYLFYDWPKINEHVFLKFKCTSYIHVDIDMLPDLQGTDKVYFGQDTECKFQHCDIILFVHVCTMHWKSYQYARMHCNLKSTTFVCMERFLQWNIL